MAPTTRPRTRPARGRRTTSHTTSRMPTRLGRTSSAKSKQRRGIGGMLAGLMPARAASKATPSSKKGKAGGAAVLAAAAGMAFRNRDKLTAMLKKKRSGADERQMPPATPAPRPTESANTPGV